MYETLISITVRLRPVCSPTSGPLPMHPTHFHTFMPPHLVHDSTSSGAVDLLVVVTAEEVTAKLAPVLHRDVLDTKELAARGSVLLRATAIVFRGGIRQKTES